eukprot:8769570-Pyramimonas_sp.AAC.1
MGAGGALIAGGSSGALIAGSGARWNSASGSTWRSAAMFAPCQRHLGATPAPRRRRPRAARSGSA